MSIPLAIRRQIWSWHYASQAFEHCRAACNYTLNHQLEEEDPLYYPLNVAIVVCYCRPFKWSDGLEILPKDIVPQRFKKMHGKLIDMRDKIFAHFDAKRPEWIPEVIFIVGEKGNGLTLKEHKLDLPSILNIQRLSEILFHRCEEELKIIGAKHAAGFPKEYGNYKIGIRGYEPDFEKVDRDEIPSHWVNPEEEAPEVK